MTLRGTIAGCADSCWLCVALMCAGYVLPGGFLPALCCLNVCRSCVAGRGAFAICVAECVLPVCAFAHSLLLVRSMLAQQITCKNIQRIHEERSFN